MAINLSALSVTHPQQAETLRRLCEARARVMRDPDATPQTPNANSDAFGFPVKTNAPTGPQTGAREVDTYDCTFKVESASVDAQSGGEGGRSVAFSVARIGFLRIDAPDVRAGDTLEIGAMKVRVTSFKVTSAHSPWIFALGQL